jgi:hypothetical protein
MAVITAIGGLIGVATAVYELREKLRPPPIEASITPSKDFLLDVRWPSYRADNPDVKPGPGATNQYGIVFTVEVELKGLSGKTAVLRWRVLDGDGAPQGSPAWVPLQIELQPDQQTWSVTRQIWAAPPPQVSRFRLEFSIDDHEGTTRGTVRGPQVRMGIG